MKYSIQYFTYKDEKNALRKEYYISEKGGNIIAGDFNSYKAARSYIVKTLSKSNKN